MEKLKFKFVIFLIQSWLCLFNAKAYAEELPDSFVYLADIAPNIQCDLKYLNKDNFVGSRIDGYMVNQCIVTIPAAQALKEVNKKLNVFGLQLKIFDAYRPQTAVNHFVRWANDHKDTKNKLTYYPDIKKENLFKEGYIAEKSGHSRGSTVDLTIVNGADELDMGGIYDFFGPQSWVAHATLSSQQRANRLLLKELMEQHGFKSYRKEWWHFTFKNEPFPANYFDFPVR